MSNFTPLRIVLYRLKIQTYAGKICVRANKVNSVQDGADEVCSVEIFYNPFIIALQVTTQWKATDNDPPVLIYSLS